jgi:hypothetical protein
MSDQILSIVWVAIAMAVLIVGIGYTYRKGAKYVA